VKGTLMNEFRQHHRFIPFNWLWFLIGAVALPTATVNAGEYLSGITWPEPPIVAPGKTDQAPPSDAIVLFDGTDASAWQGADRWRVVDSVLVAGRGMISTQQTFGDCQLHIEWSSPLPAKGSGQARGNSGLFFGPYEIQILDSYENTTYFDGQAAAIYKQSPPLVNAMRKPGEWNSYDVIWKAPRFHDDGELLSPATVTVLHNGVVVQNNFTLLGDTPYNRPPRYKQHPETLPIRLQDHGNPVRFRNIWVRPLKPLEGKQTAPAGIHNAGNKNRPVVNKKPQVELDKLDAADINPSDDPPSSAAFSKAKSLKSNESEPRTNVRCRKRKGWVRR
jgi:hypothetical protein